MIQANDENGKAILPFRGVHAYCPMCNQKLTPKCGNIKIHHFAHKGVRDCDPWYEPISDWHLSWQQLAFPFTEVAIERNGVKHRADIAYPSGLIIEIQNSKLSLEEKIERERFYQNMFWILNAKEWGIQITEEANVFKELFCSMKPRQNWFINSQNEKPIFLDLGNDTIIQITEFDKIQPSKISFWGKTFNKENFVNLFFNENFYDLEGITISKKFSEYIDRKNLETAFVEWNKQSQEDSFHEIWARQEWLRRMNVELKDRLYREKFLLKKKQDFTPPSISRPFKTNEEKFLEDCCRQTEWETARGKWPNRYKHT